MAGLTLNYPKFPSRHSSALETRSTGAHVETLAGQATGQGP